MTGKKRQSERARAELRRSNYLSTTHPVWKFSIGCAPLSCLHRQSDACGIGIVDTGTPNSVQTHDENTISHVILSKGERMVRIFLTNLTNVALPRIYLMGRSTFVIFVKRVPKIDFKR